MIQDEPLAPLFPEPIYDEPMRELSDTAHVPPGPTSDEAPFTPPESERVFASGEEPFIPPDNERVNAPKPTEDDGADKDRARLQSLVEVDNKSVEDLARDFSFQPLDFYSENVGHISQPLFKKLVAAEKLRRSEGITPGAVKAGVSSGLTGVGHMAKAGFKLAADIPVTSPAIVKKAQDVFNRMKGGESIDTAIANQVKQDVAEAEAGVETMAFNWNSMMRSLVRKLVNNPALLIPGPGGVLLDKVRPDSVGKVNADISAPSEFLQPVDDEKSFIRDAAFRKQQQNLARGQGAFGEFIGLDAETLAKDNITLDPDVMAGWSFATDPMMWAPIVAGARVVKAANGTFQAVDKAGTIIATAPKSEGLARMIQKAAEVTASGLDKARRGLSATAGRRSIMAPAGLVGVASGALSPGTGVTLAATKVAAQTALRGMQEIAELAATPTASRALSETIRDGGHLVSSVGKGALAGAAISLPFAAAMDEPDEQVGMVTTGAGLGGLTAAAPQVVPLVKNGATRAKEITLAARWQTGGKLEPVKAAVFNVPGMEVMENAHAAAREALHKKNPQDAYKLDLLRAGLKARTNGIEAYLMTPEQAVTLNPDLANKRGATPVRITDAKGRPKDIMAWITDENGNVNSLVHEPGHFFLDQVATPDERAALLASFSDRQAKAFQAEYAKSEGLTPEQRAKVDTIEKAREELAAEHIGHVMEGKALSGAGPNYRAKIANVLVGIMERVGLYSPDIVPGYEGQARQNVSRFGVEQSNKSSNLAQIIVDNFALDPEVNAAMRELASGKAEPLPAIPEPAKPVKPAHEVAYEALKSGSFEKGIADSLFAKLKKGPLNARDLAMWQQIFPGIEVPGAAPVPPPVPKAAVPPPVPVATPPPLPEAPVIQPRPEPKVIFSDVDPGTPPPLSEAPIVPVQPDLGAAPIRPAPPVVTPPPAPPVVIATPPPVPPNIRGQTKGSYAPFGGPAREAAAGRIAEAKAAVEVATLPDEVKAANNVLLENAGKPVEIIYDSAAETGSKNAESYRLRRVEVEKARSNPSLRAAATKLGVIPLDTVITKGGDVQHVVWSGDAALVNIGRVLSEATATGNERLVPYTMKDGKLVDGGAQLATDLVNYTKNQNNGYKGDGGTLARPENPKGFIPDVNPDYTPVPLSPEVANFANLLMGERPPKTTIIRNKDVVPVQVRAKAIADVNARKGTVVGPEYVAPYKGVSITDYNPLRVEMEAGGMNLKDLNPVHERINADRVKSATPMEGVDLQPTATDVTAAGFMPAKKVTVNDVAKMSPEDYFVTARAWANDAMAGKGLTVQSQAEQAALREPNRAMWQSAADTATKEVSAIRDEMMKNPAILSNPEFQAKYGGAAMKVQFFNEGLKIIDGQAPEPVKSSFLPSKDVPVQTDRRKTGQAFSDFFSSVINEQFGKSKVPYEAGMDMSAHAPFVGAMSKYSAGFAEHISKSIPLYLESQVALGDAIVKSYPEGARVLDVGSSEGYFGKAISDQSGGKIETVSLDPNNDMRAAFDRTPAVKGATFTTDAFREGFQDGDTFVKAYNSAEPFDVINESMTFQFINNDRAGQFAEVKRLLKPDGVFSTRQKVLNDSWAANEALKDSQWKNKYFTAEDLKAKESVVGFKQSKSEEKAVGMVDNMVTDLALEAELKNNFKHVEQIWDSGNFKGYAASDDAAKLRTFVDNVANTDSKFSTGKTPRVVEGEASYMPAKTKAGKAMEETGLKLEKYYDTETSRILFRWMDGNTQAASLSVTLKGKGTAYAGMALTDPEYRRQGLSEALYREAGTELQSMGVKQLKGDVFADGPVEIRKKVFGPENTVVKPFEQGGGIGSVVTKIDPDMQFMPRKKVDADLPELDVENTDYSKYNVKAKSSTPKLGPINTRLPNSAKGEVFDVVHFSAKAGLANVDPKFFGGGKATPTDLRGSPKSYFFVKGSEFGQDTNLFKDKGLNEYATEINGARLYDLRAGKTDKLGWRKTVNRVAADEAVQEAGYDGLVLDTADGRQIVAMFKPVEVSPVDTIQRLPENAPLTDYMPAKKVAAPLPEREPIIDQLELGAPPPPVDRYSRAYMNRLTPEQLKEYFPEALVGKKGPIKSNLVGSALVKKHGMEKAVQIVAEKLVKRYRDAVDGGDVALAAATKLGEQWYERFAPELREFFKDDTQLFAEFLASTSPNTNPEQNFAMAKEAYQLYKAGWFDELIAKFEEGLKGVSDGSTLEAYKRSVKPVDRPQNISEATLMRWWVDKHDLKPTKAPRLNGKTLSVEDQTLYGISSYAVLKVAARKWMTQNSGPKTAQFVGNLTGMSDGATIDVWADRTLRRAVYEDTGKPWRILPENSTAVTDADFAFGQRAFARAAEKLGIKPSALQGALWFAEKAHWAEKGWSPLNLGDFMPHLQELKAQGMDSLLSEIPVSKAKALADVEIKRRALVDAAKDLKKAEKAQEMIIRKAEKAQQTLF